MRIILKNLMLINGKYNGTVENEILKSGINFILPAIKGIL